MIKWFIFIFYMVLVIGLALFLYSCLRISSICSRDEEQRERKER